MSSLARQFLTAVVTEGVPDPLFQGNITPMFVDTEQGDLNFIRDHLSEYGKLPSPITFAAFVGDTLPVVHEPATYYLDHLRQVHIERTLRVSMKGATDLLINKASAPSEALGGLYDTINTLVSDVVATSVTDLRFARDMIWSEYVRVATGNMDGRVLTGWPSLDKMTMGLTTGDLTSICGRPGSGKSWSVFNMAVWCWKNQKKRPLVVSMEMERLPVLQRMACIASGVSITALKTGSLSTAAKQTFLDALYAFEDYERPLWVVDGNLTATVDDLYGLALQRKPDIIIIDGAYLLRTPKEMDSFKRVAATAEAVKCRLCPIAPVVATWQFNRGASKKKEGEPITLADIAYSDTIGQLSSLVLGLFQEELAEEVSTRKYQVLKGRNGETGDFRTRWCFGPKMDFSEITDESTEDVGMDFD